MVTRYPGEVSGHLRNESPYRVCSQSDRIIDNRYRPILWLPNSGKVEARRDSAKHAGAPSFRTVIEANPPHPFRFCRVVVSALMDRTTSVFACRSQVRDSRALHGLSWGITPWNG